MRAIANAAQNLCGSVAFACIREFVEILRLLSSKEKSMLGIAEIVCMRILAGQKTGP